ncbi:hypothetical protein K2173_001355 [Erythroxylum novogranatense]|uniref:DUF4378 domain-containing protein n=1 Tax=Erythroxylum novogranatense TaxID=1862640 RepID=A0AAV8T4J8_9ROSI|nr:hypothetical protein K2173_001355 [Erythroxylum novogranatense]
MNETAGKSTSCLAITEKRAQRPGGCVGIFFQLFDRNRRFVKRLMFSKKLLPPARSKQGSKRFGGDEKMPKAKLHVIADENSGGFPSVKKNGHRGSTEQKHEMRPPCLVARLMGLESLPAVNRDKYKKALNSVTSGVRQEDVASCFGGSDRGGLKMDKGSAKVESRPQKLQKTEQIERRAVTRFGADALQIKSVLSRSRKHHPSKLASPVKSPRISSSRNVSRASRLIDAATRILEPGLQATNRAKSALTYSNPAKFASEQGIMTEGTRTISSDVMEQLPQSISHDISASESLLGQNSCQNCSNVLNLIDSRANLDEQQLIFLPCASNLVSISTQGLNGMKPSPHVSSLGEERDVVEQKNGDQLCTAAEKQDGIRPQDEPVADGKSVFQLGQVQQQSRSQQCRPQKDDPSSLALKQHEMAVGSERTPARVRLNNAQSRRASAAVNTISGAKNFVALNRNLSGSSRQRMSTIVDDSTIDGDRKFCNRRDDSFSQIRSPVRKRRTVSANIQVGSTGFTNSMSVGNGNKSGVVRGKDMMLNTPSKDQRYSNSRSEGNRAGGNKDNTVISFTFNSPLKQKTSISADIRGRLDQMDVNPSHQKVAALEETSNKAYFQTHCPLRGDALGLLLEKKLKELISQEDDEFASGGNIPKRSIAMILQELISALNAENPILPDNWVSQSEKMSDGPSIRLTRQGEHLSPASVLEASFFNDSCLSSSLDDNSGQLLPLDAMDYSYNQPPPEEIETDILDSVTLMNEGMTGGKIVTNLLSYISRILQSINLAGGGLTDDKLTHAKEVILKAELLFGNAALQNSDRMRSFLIGPVLLDELESVHGVQWTKFSHLLGFSESKDDNIVRRFLFDCLIECLDSKYGRYSNSGFRTWKRVKFCKNADMLIQEVEEEVKRWTSLAGMIPDEIIEWEMSNSLGKWTDFGIEAFETGSEVDWGILEMLVEEIVIDLWECRTS